MEDADKTREQLLDEIAQLRQRVQALETLTQQNSSPDRPDQRLEELQRQEEFRLVTDAVPALISFVDANGCYRFNNRTYEDWFGYPRSTFYGLHLSQVFDAAAWENIRPAVEKALSGERVNFEQELFYPAIGKRYVDITYIPRWGADGTVMGFVVLIQDITERKQTEAALQQSEALAKLSENLAKARAEELETFMETVPAAVWIAHDPQCHTMTVNRAAYDLMRLSPGAVMTATPDSGEYPFQFKIQQQGQDLPLSELPMQQAGRTGQPVEAEFEFVFSAEDVRSIYGKAVPVHDETEAIRGVIGAFIDVTERKRTEAALRENQERLTLALDAARMGSWDWDLQTNQVVWSPFHEMIFGYEPGKPHRTYPEWASRVHPEDLPRVEAEIQTARAERREYEDEYRVVWPNGSLHWVSSYGRFQYNSDGQPVRMLGMLFDITARKQSETILRHNELIFRTLADTMPQMFWITQPDGSHEYFNQRWYEYTGDRLEQTQGQGWQAILHSDDRQHTIDVWKNSLRTGELYEIEYRLRRADGEYRWHLGRALPLRNEQGCIVKWFGSCTDIHDQKLAIEERAQALDRERAARLELEKASRMKDEFLAVLSHELRSPLNAILGWSRLLRTRKLDPDKTEQAMASIERNALAQTQLIEDLLDISRIIQGQMRLTLQPTPLLPLIEAAIDTVRPTASAKSIQIEFGSDADLVFVSGDANRLQQVVWNLLSNAVKFTPEGGHVKVRLEQKQRQCQLMISDTGKGIRADFLPYVFDRFRLADATTTRTEGGLGLGLAIVRNLVELHGGTVAVASPGEGQGSTFTVQLPLLLDAMPNPHVERLVQGMLEREAVLPLKGLRILAVDDETDTREFLKAALEQYGANVTLAASTQEALDLLQTVKPDLLLSDIGMPGEDGYHLIEKVRSLPPTQGGHTPAAALTAYARESDQHQALTAGFQFHLTKPIEPLQLLTVVLRLAS